jgi:hypothetical protein
VRGWWGGEGGCGIVKGGGRGKGGEMTQTLYVHINNKKRMNIEFLNLLKSP